MTAKRTEPVTVPSKIAWTRSDDIAILRRIATHISETLYFASSAIQKAHTQADSKFITHDDYDLLRQIADQLEIEYLEARLKELKK